MEYKGGEISKFSCNLLRDHDFTVINLSYFVLIDGDEFLWNLYEMFRNCYKIMHEILLFNEL